METEELEKAAVWIEYQIKKDLYAEGNAKVFASIR